MTLSHLSKLMLVGATALASTAAHAAPQAAPSARGDGRVTGNGGGAIVCILPGGPKAELLDFRLWEERKGNEGKKFPRNNKLSKEAQLEAAIRKFHDVDPVRANLMRKVLETTLAAKKIDPPGKYALMPPSDTNLRFLNTELHCSLKGAAEFHDEESDTQSDDFVYWDKRIVNLMPITDQAGLEFHEAVYQVLRNGVAKAVNSEVARNITAAAFVAAAQDTAIPVVRPSLGTEGAHFECDADNAYHFYITRVQDQRVRLEFTRIGGRNLVDRTIWESVSPMNTYPEKTHRVLIKRMRDGFQRTYELAGPKQDGDDWYASSFVTSSFFEPDYQIELSVQDLVSATGNAEKDKKKPSIDWDHYFIERNAFAQFKLKWQSGSQNHKTVSCRRLP